MVKLGIVFYGEAVAGTLNDFVGIGVIKREVATVLALDEACCYGEIVEASVNLALMECGWYADGAVDLYARQPEIVAEMYFVEWHLAYLLLVCLWGSHAGCRHEGQSRENDFTVIHHLFLLFRFLLSGWNAA